MLYVGNDPISKLYIGDDEISKLYQGENEIFSSGGGTIEEKIVLEVKPFSEYPHINIPGWPGVKCRITSYYNNIQRGRNDGFEYEQSRYNESDECMWDIDVSNTNNYYYVEYTPIIDGSYDGHTEPWYGWAKGMCEVGRERYDYDMERRNLTRIIYDKTYMGFADSATNTGDNFRQYQYSRTSYLELPTQEYLPDTVTTIGNNFRCLQYVMSGISDIAAETCPNSVTSIGDYFRIYQYHMCDNITSAANEVISNNVTTINYGFRFGQYCNCVNLRNTSQERLSNVTSIGDGFRYQQYRGTAVTKSADEYIPNTVTTIGNAFKSEQYAGCYSLSEIGQLSDLSNVNCNGDGFRHMQFINNNALTQLELPVCKIIAGTSLGGIYEQICSSSNLSKLTINYCGNSITYGMWNGASTSSNVATFTLVINGGYISFSNMLAISNLINNTSNRILDVEGSYYRDYVNDSDRNNNFTIITHGSPIPPEPTPEPEPTPSGGVEINTETSVTNVDLCGQYNPIIKFTLPEGTNIGDDYSIQYNTDIVNDEELGYSDEGGYWFESLFALSEGTTTYEIINNNTGVTEDSITITVTNTLGLLSYNDIMDRYPNDIVQLVDDLNTHAEEQYQILNLGGHTIWLGDDNDYIEGTNENDGFIIYDQINNTRSHSTA